MSQIGVGIIGLGWFLPPKIRGNDFWPKDFNPRSEEELRRDLLSVERTSRGERPLLPPEVAEACAALGSDPFRGARQRHVLDENDEVSDMEAQAARRAIQSANLRPDQIDLVIVSSLVPDQLLPSNAPSVQAKCDIPNAAAWSLDVGCASFQAQVMTAASLIRSRFCKNVLVVISTALSRITNYKDPLSCLIGDGAAAAVISEMPAGYGLIGQWTRTEPSLRDGVVHAPFVEGKPHPRWHKAIGPIGIGSFNPDALKQAGRNVAAYCREACLGALGVANVDISDVSLYIGNQSLGWFVDACRRSLGLPPDKAIDTFQEVANIGGAAILFNLDRAHRDRRIKDGDIVLMYSQGAGVNRAALAYRWMPTA